MQLGLLVMQPAMQTARVGIPYACNQEIVVDTYQVCMHMTTNVGPMCMVLKVHVLEQAHIYTHVYI